MTVHERGPTSYKLTATKLLWLFTDDPMPAINIRDLESRKESANNGQCLVGNVVTLGASDKQRRAVPSGLVRVLEGEIGHVVESVCQILDGNAESLDAVLFALQVCQEELANGEAGLVLRQDVVGF